MAFPAPASLLAGSSPPAKTAEPPRLTVDTTYVPPRGKTHVVHRGGSFQAALDAARPGDVIMLEAGATFTGPFRLPVKPGSEWIVVRSSALEGRRPPPAWRRWVRAPPRSGSPESTLPPPGHRVDPAYAPLMPKLVAASAPVIVTAPGAHHYRFIGIEIRPGGSGKRSTRQLLRSTWRWITGANAAAAPTMSFAGQNLVLLGGNETSVEKLPHHIIFDRCYLHGDPKGGARRGIAMNSRYTAVVDSYLSDFKEVGEDAQAIAGWNGSGPFKIANNYLEGAGENVLFGGADPSIPELVPSDIEIRGNHFAKPLSWKIGDPNYEGTPWTVKNLFELKNARRVLIDGNLFEYNWHHAQTGFAILFTVRNQDGAAPWSVVDSVTFTNNVLRHIGGGVHILGYDNNHPSQQTRRIHIKNNLFDDVGGVWGRGLLFQLVDGTADVVIEHNTAMQTDSIVAGWEQRPHTGFIFANNIAPHNDYGFIGEGTGVGNPSLERHFPDAIVQRNVIVGGSAQAYPRDNFFPRSLDDVGFVDRAGGDYRLKGSSRYKNVATNGGHIGVDFETLRMAMGPGWADDAADATEDRQWSSASRRSRSH
jgi:hypothetical protein